MKKGFAIFSLFVFVFCQILTNLSVWENISLCLFIYFFLEFLYDLGKRILILDLTIIMAILTCLVLPVIFYHVYTRENPMAKLWAKFMPVSSDEYFSFTVPATLMMVLGFRIRLGNFRINKNPKIYMDNVRKILENKPTLGLALIAVGLTSGVLDFLSPASLKQFFYLLDHLTYVGVFYVLYSPNKYKRIIVPSVIVLMIVQTMVTGMFGDFIFMLACALSLILLGKRIPFYRKVLVAISGMFLIIVIQSIKSDYRARVWTQGSGADPVYFTQLIFDRVSDPSQMFDPNKIFFVATRMNQGWLVANTMKNVPAKHDFANGETIWQSVAASFVPRFLWPDKPEAGGKYNLKRFWGFNIVGFSMNIGPLGEAYANFDVAGGIVYMFFYGFFFNIVLSSILKLCEKRPTLILWVPFLFFYAIGVETDLLTTMGSLIKGVIFVWIVFRAYKIALRIDL